MKEPYSKTFDFDIINGTKMLNELEQINISLLFLTAENFLDLYNIESKSLMKEEQRTLRCFMT